MKMTRNKRFKITWCWPDGSLGNANVPYGILDSTLNMLRSDTRVYLIKIGGISLNDHVHRHGLVYTLKTA